MKVELYQKIERTVAREAIRGLFADDFKISVFDGEQTTLEYSTGIVAIEAAMFTTDEDQLHVEHQHIAEEGWMLLIYSDDGHDVIADHTTNLELSLKDASGPADKIADGDSTTLACVLVEVGT